MFILHIALQGCVRARDVAYGLTPDTGGHIRYLLELVAAADRREAVSRQEIVVRRFEDERLGPHYAATRERLSAKSRIVRLDGATTGYVSKEEMHGEIDALAASLAEHLLSLDRLPDIIHAHYADGGLLALAMKERFGLPFVFTAHSLGRVKREAEPHLAADPVLARRIAVEDRVIAAADLIVASSTDEARLQYGLYPTARPGRIRVNPPGCDWSLYAGPDRGGEARAAADRIVEGRIAEDRIAEGLAPFLRHPERPLVLAIARPVRKKNLAGLVRAFAADPRLRERANLAIYAGCRTDIEALDLEAQGVMRELLRLVDAHDLWGRVALPKRHDPGDVPAIYRLAAGRRGVFANPATNEPFGLTLLEAAASGLPVVATQSGGPVDIVGHCRNGTLVDPRDPEAFGAAMADLMEDGARWDEAARNGRRGAAHFDWDRHVERHLRDLAGLRGRPAPRRRSIAAPAPASPASLAGRQAVSRPA